VDQSFLGLEISTRPVRRGTVTKLQQEKCCSKAPHLLVIIKGSHVTYFAFDPQLQNFGEEERKIYKGRLERRRERDCTKFSQLAERLIMARATVCTATPDNIPIQSPCNNIHPGSLCLQI
jgi:hypothetical protein